MTGALAREAALLVPSTVVLLGRWNWWPSALSRRSARPAMPEVIDLSGHAQRRRR
jgi:hypothetical protein